MEERFQGLFSRYVEVSSSAKSKLGKPHEVSSAIKMISRIDALKAEFDDIDSLDREQYGDACRCRTASFAGKIGGLRARLAERIGETGCKTDSRSTVWSKGGKEDSQRWSKRF